MESELLDPPYCFIKPLEDSGLAYCVTGSIASGIYGEPRFTNDIDFLLFVDLRGIARLTSAFPAVDYYVPPLETLLLELRRDHRGMFNVIHQPSQFKAGIFIVARDPLQRWALEHRRRVELSHDLQTWAAPPEYVILRKLKYFREGAHEKHLRDIRFMLAATPELDHDFIDSQIARLGLQAQWRIVQEPGEPIFPAT